MIIPLALTAGGIAAEQRPADGAVLARNCAACHRLDASTGGDIPGLGGRSRDDLVAAMTKARNGHSLMSRIAKGYSDDEIRLIAAFLSERPRKPTR
ncbi:MAG: c-type cytochrome [Methylotetracoccus sp.]